MNANPVPPTPTITEINTLEIVDGYQTLRVFFLPHGRIMLQIGACDYILSKSSVEALVRRFDRHVSRSRPL